MFHMQPHADIIFHNVFRMHANVAIVVLKFFRVVEMKIYCDFFSVVSETLKLIARKKKTPGVIFPIQKK